MNNPVPPPPLVMPDLIELTDFDGNFASYLDYVYQAFKRDFVYKKPVYRGTILALKSHPIVDGRECTFYHITHEGNIEENREPNIRRMERINYPKFLIENCDHPDVFVWEKKQNGKVRILIFHPGEGYLIVLEKRIDYILFWTAYYVEHSHSRRRLIAEYKASLKP